jgi:hypothetical protein
MAVHQSAATAKERASVQQLERRMPPGRRRLRGPRKSHRHQQPALFFWQTRGNFSRFSHEEPAGVRYMGTRYDPACGYENE